MRHGTRIAILAAGIVLGLGALAGPAAAGQVLPSPLKGSHCSVLHRLHGAARDRHLLYHLCGSDHALYRRMYATVAGESHWQAGATNPSSSARGYAQFLSGWYAGRWHFDPRNGALNLRVFYYVVTHPRSTGGWANWNGH